jgi:hypothetical protein
LTAPGVVFDQVPKPEIVMEKWQNITRLDNAKYYDNFEEMTNDLWN